jgi:ABC-type nickel/cobalt efflux system permease component RcnA
LRTEMPTGTKTIGGNGAPLECHSPSYPSIRSMFQGSIERSGEKRSNHAARRGPSKAATRRSSETNTSMRRNKYSAVEACGPHGAGDDPVGPPSKYKGSLGNDVGNNRRRANQRLPTRNGFQNTHTHTHTHTHAHASVHAGTHTQHIRTHAHTHALTHACTHTHTHGHTRTHMDTHTHLLASVIERISWS